MKKILHLSSEATWRGGEQQMAYLIEESRKVGVKTIVAGKENSAFEVWCKENEIPFFPMGFKNGLDFFTSRRIKKVAEREDVDLVHSHSGKSQSLVYWSYLMGLKKPVIAHRRVDFPLKSKGPSLKKYTFENLKAIICVSKTIERMVREKVSGRVETVYSGIDFSRFSNHPPSGYLHEEFSIDRSKKLVANVSAIADQKDYPTFLRTVREFTKKSENAHFLIVGDGNLKAEMEGMSKELGLDEYVTFTGFRKDVPQVLRELSVFFISSKTEGLGTTVIDAMHNSLSVLATKGGGIPELVVDGETGLLCEIGDHNGLADKLITLLADDELRTRLGENGYVRSQLFSKEEMAKQVLAIYDDILG